MRRVRWFAALAASALAASWLAGPALAQETIKVGVPMILSGAGAQFGEPIVQGARMYAEEVNAAGGVLGRKIEIVPRDTKSRPDEAVRVSRDLILRDRVQFLVGTFTSGEGPAVSEIAKENRRVFLALGPKTDRLTAPDALHPYVWRVSANTTTEGRAAAEIVASWNPTRVATVAPDFAYGRDGVAAFVAHLKKLRPGIEIVDQQWPRLNETDYSPFVTAQMAARPDAVFSVVCCGNFDAFAKQAKPLGYFEALKGRFLGVGEAGSVEALRSLGDEYPVGIWGNTYDAYDWTPPDPAVAAAHKDYGNRLRKFAGLGPSDPLPSWSIQGYLGMQFLVEAIRKAGSLDQFAVSKALEDLVVQSPQGPVTMRGRDHQANRAQLYGQASRPPGSAFPQLAGARAIDPTPFMD